MARLVKQEESPHSKGNKHNARKSYFAEFFGKNGLYKYNRTQVLLGLYFGCFSLPYFEVFFMKQFFYSRLVDMR